MISVDLSEAMPVYMNKVYIQVTVLCDVCLYYICDESFLREQYINIEWEKNKEN